MGANKVFGLAGERRRPSLLVVHGGDRKEQARVEGRVHLGGNSDILKLLPEGVGYDTLNLSSGLRSSRQSLKRGAADLSAYQCVLNLVTDPDQHPRTLQTLQLLLRHYSGPVLNPPDAVLKSTRDQVARQLHGIPGLVVPAILRLRNPRPGAVLAAVERKGLRFPLIVRLAGTHGGQIIGRAYGPEELEQACAGRGDYILTEFVEFVSPDGLYRKYRVFIFGKQRVLRHMLAGDSWNIHARQRLEFMARHPLLIDEEKALFAASERTFPSAVREALPSIGDKLPLDFFGVDFGIDGDGQAVLFEANATMNFFPFLPDPRFDYVRQCIEPARRALLGLLGFDHLAPSAL